MNSKIEVEYYVCFMQAQHWIGKFLKKNFSHVYLVKHEDINWMVIKPENDGRLKVDLLMYYFEGEEPRPVCELKDVRKIVLSNTTILKIKADLTYRNKVSMRLDFMNCVGMAKALLGINAWVLTPYALYKTILKRKMGTLIHGG